MQIKSAEKVKKKAKCEAGSMATGGYPWRQSERRAKTGGATAGEPGRLKREVAQREEEKKKSEGRKREEPFLTSANE